MNLCTQYMEIDMRLGAKVTTLGWNHRNARFIHEMCYNVLIHSKNFHRSLWPYIFRFANAWTLATVVAYVWGIPTVNSFPNWRTVKRLDSGLSVFHLFLNVGFQTGRLKKFPEKWNHSHRILWECSESCPCGSECPSRSAQLGLRWIF